MLYNNFEYWDIFILLSHERIQKIAYVRKSTVKVKKIIAFQRG